MIVAQFDLSTELGVSGRFDAPVLVDAVRHAERVILEAGIAMGCAAFTREQARASLARGYRILVHGFDVLMLKEQVRQAAGWHRA